MKVKYYINGIDFETYKVYVKSSGGVLDLPKRKKPTEIEYPDSNGKIIDLDTPRFEGRTITLECSILANNVNTFVTRCNSFVSLFCERGLQCLEIGIGTQKLVYFVYLSANVKVNKQWREADMIGTFTLTLEEPQSEKCVFVSNGGNVTLTFNVPSSSSNYGSAGLLKTPYSVCKVSTANVDEVTSPTGVVNLNGYPQGRPIVVYGVDARSSYITLQNASVLWQHLY